MVTVLRPAMSRLGVLAQYRFMRPASVVLQLWPTAAGNLKRS